MFFDNIKYELNQLLTKSDERYFFVMNDSFSSSIGMKITVKI